MLAQADEFEVVREVQVRTRPHPPRVQRPNERLTCRLLDWRAQEYFADYLSLLPSLFTLSLPPLAPTPTVRPTLCSRRPPRVGTDTIPFAQSPLPPLPLYSSSPQTFNPPSLDLHLQGLLALLLSLKKKPLIRWERMSGTAKKLAGEVGYAMQGGQGGSYGDLFNFRGVSGAQPLLLILGESPRRVSGEGRPRDAR